MLMKKVFTITILTISSSIIIFKLLAPIHYKSEARIFLRPKTLNYPESDGLVDYFTPVDENLNRSLLEKLKSPDFKQKIKTPFFEIERVEGTCIYIISNEDISAKKSILSIQKIVHNINYSTKEHFIIIDTYPEQPVIAWNSIIPITKQKIFKLTAAKPSQQ